MKKNNFDLIGFMNSKSLLKEEKEQLDENIGGVISVGAINTMEGSKLPEYFTENNLDELEFGGGTKRTGDNEAEEDEREEDLMAHVEIGIDNLLFDAKQQAYDIGGDFGGPGIWSRVKKLVRSKM